MTIEERDARKKRRAEIKKLEAKKYPLASYHSGDFHLFFEAGDERHIRVRIKDLEIFTPLSEGGKWAEAYLFLEKDIESLAKFVTALTARLNGMIERANEEVEKIPKTIPVKSVS